MKVNIGVPQGRSNDGPLSLNLSYSTLLTRFEVITDDDNLYSTEKDLEYVKSLLESEFGVLH